MFKEAKEGWTDEVAAARGDGAELVTVDGDDFIVRRYVHPFGGEGFDCFYPVERSEGEEEEEEEEEEEAKEEEVVVSAEEDAELARRALSWALTLPCVRKVAGWWTYELCAHEGAVFLDQFHIEQRTIKEADPTTGQAREKVFAEIGATYSLGHSASETVTRIDRSRGTPVLVVDLADGTVCDLTGEPRRTEVHYHCALDARTPAIVHFSEPSSCAYLLRIDSSTLCEEPELQPEQQEEMKVECIPAAGEEAAAIAVRFAADVAERRAGRRETSFVEYTAIVYEEPEEEVGPAADGGGAGSSTGAGRVRAPDAAGRARRDTLLAQGWVSASSAVRAAEAGLPSTPRLRSADELADVRYAVGQIIRHDRYDYRAIILAYDPVCMKDDTWQEEMGVDRLVRGANQPFYLVAVDVRDRSPAQRTYVAQEHVRALLSEADLDEYDADYIDNPVVVELFGDLIGTRYRPGRNLGRIHPEDVDVSEARDEL